MNERGLFNIDKKIYELKDKLFKLKKQQLELEDSILALEEERMFSSTEKYGFVEEARCGGHCRGKNNME